ncbi:hypothetical protein GQ44DRAFT_754753 [Phaeosphaeriaceae sp. PMI808]|nr:hypothetical protein GQ44DRAFT_754753 [Phaeosphaeriaceae sp. PMI808]
MNLLLHTDHVTENPLDVLAGIGQSPAEPRDAFTSVASTGQKQKQSGRRGRKRHKVKPSIPQQDKAVSLDELSEKTAALRLKDEKSAEDSQERSWKDHDLNTVTRPSVAILTDSVRHVWAPQFRPNSLPPPSKPLASTTNPILPKEPPRLPERTLSPVRLFSTASETPIDQSNESQFFPLSAFLASPNSTKCALQAPKASKELSNPSSPRLKSLVTSSPVNARKEVVAAALKALVSKKVRPILPFGIPDKISPLTGFCAPISEPSLVSMAPFADSSSPDLQTHSAEHLPIFPPLPLSLLHTQFSPSSLPHTSFPSPQDSNTAPLPTTSQKLVKAPPSDSTLAAQGLASPPPAPEVHKQLNEFLSIGHANSCWCNTQVPVSSTKALPPHLPPYFPASPPPTPRLSPSPLSLKTIGHLSRLSHATRTATRSP